MLKRFKVIVVLMMLLPMCFGVGITASEITVSTGGPITPSDDWEVKKSSSTTTYDDNKEYKTEFFIEHLVGRTRYTKPVNLMNASVKHNKGNSDLSFAIFTSNSKATSVKVDAKITLTLFKNAKMYINPIFERSNTSQIVQGVVATINKNEKTGYYYFGATVHVNDVATRTVKKIYRKVNGKYKRISQTSSFDKGVAIRGKNAIYFDWYYNSTGPR